jgi:hypothetical protein
MIEFILLTVRFQAADFAFASSPIRPAHAGADASMETSVAGESLPVSISSGPIHRRAFVRRAGDVVDNPDCKPTGGATRLVHNGHPVIQW